MAARFFEAQGKKPSQAELRGSIPRFKTKPAPENRRGLN